MWGQEHDPRMPPPPLGEKGGHPHNLSKRMESDRISPETIFQLFFCILLIGLLSKITDHQPMAELRKLRTSVSFMR